MALAALYVPYLLVCESSLIPFLLAVGLGLGDGRRGGECAVRRVRDSMTETVG